MGDDLNDLDMLQAADRAFVIEPISPSLAAVAGVTVLTDFDELPAHLPASRVAA